MVKLLLLSLSLLSNVITEKLFQVVSKHYDEGYHVIEEESYELKMKTEHVDVWTDGTSFILDFANNQVTIVSDNVKCIEANDFVNVFYSDRENFILEKYNYKGNKIEEEIILYHPLESFQVKEYKNTIYIVGKIYPDAYFDKGKDYLGENDAIIIKVGDNINYQLFGGSHDEGFEDIIFTDDSIYVAGFKDYRGDGDFSGGGIFQNSPFIAMLDHQLMLKDYVFINVDATATKYLSHNGDYIYWMTDKYIAKFTLDLQLRSGIEEEIEAGVVNDHFITIIGEEISIYDSNLNLQMQVNNDFSKVNNINNSFYGVKDDERLLFDIIDVNSLNHYDIYQNDVALQLMQSAFDEALLTTKNYQPFFDPVIYGDYVITYHFTTCGGIEFTVEKNQKVLLESNVCNNGVYPLGYRLLFSGYGVLNDNPIMNNYQVSQLGNYTLKLTGANGEEETIEFIVVDEQLKFVDYLITEEEISVAINQSFYIPIRIKGDVKIAYVKIDGMMHNEFSQNGDIINVLATPYDSPGIKIMTVDALYYYINDELYQYPLNEQIIINVTNQKPSINVIYNEEENLNIMCDIIDEEKTLRTIMIEVYDGDLLKTYHYPLTSQNIYLKDAFNDTNDTIYQAIIYIGYNTSGVIQYQSIATFNFYGSGDNVMRINVQSNNNVVERINFTFARNFVVNNLVRLDVSQKIVYEGDFSGLDFYLMIGSIVGMLLLIITFTIRFTKRRNKLFIK